MDADVASWNPDDEYTVQSLKRRLELSRRNPRRRPSTPIPITLTITDLDVGGAERALTSLVLGLDRSRWSPSVVNLSAEGALADVIRAGGVPVESLSLGRRSLVRGVFRLVRALRKRSPALVQSFLFHANVLTRLAAPASGSPWVLGGLRVAERQKGWHLSVDRWTSRLGCGSVCVSEGVRRFSIEPGGLDPKRLTVIPNGVDLSRFAAASPVSRGELGIPDDAFLLLTVGRLDVQKGLPDLLTAFEQAGEKRPWLRLAIVGDGPMRGWVDEQVSTRPSLTGRVIPMGRRDDVPALMGTADLLVHAAHWEGMPNVVLEAMAAGLPVVATDVEGTDELIESGVSGRLVPPRDPRALAKAIATSVDDRRSTREIGRVGRVRVETAFTINRMIARYDALWSSVLGFSTEESQP